MNKEKHNISEDWIFKYGDCNHFNNVLIKNTIPYSIFSSLNDPYEATHIDELLYTEGSFPENHKKSIDKTNEIRDFINNHKISCFSHTPSEPLMWSHYANKHNGFCYCFDKNELINSQQISHHGNVIYSSQFPQLYFEDKNTSSDHLENQICKVMLTKSLHWAYEQEYRLIMKTDYPPVCAVPFNPNSLKAIIIGLKVNQFKNRYIQKINQVNETREEKIEIYIAKKHKTKYEVEISKYLKDCV